MRIATTIDDVIAQMDRRLDRAIETNDPDGYFAAVYRAVTARVRDGIEADEFDDCDRMEHFDVTFARLYLDAAEAHDAARPTSASWAVAFDHAGSPLLVLQHVLLGMNAHINLDLGIAAASTADADIAQLRDDFERLNDVLGEMVDRMQDAIATVSPWTGAVDRIGCRADELLSRWSVAHARGRAWRFANELAAADSNERLIADRDARVAAVGAAIARPGLATRVLVRLARRQESADVATVVDALRRTGARLPA